VAGDETLINQEELRKISCECANWAAKRQQPMSKTQIDAL